MINIYKFRGIRIDNGQFIYGNLVIDINGKTSIIDYANHETETYTWHDVIPETVGQLLSFKDHLKNEIYEGDKLSNFRNSEKIVEDIVSFERYVDENYGWFTTAHVVGNIHEAEVIVH